MSPRDYALGLRGVPYYGASYAAEMLSAKCIVFRARPASILPSRLPPPLSLHFLMRTVPNAFSYGVMLSRGVADIRRHCTDGNLMSQMQTIPKPHLRPIPRAILYSSRLPVHVAQPHPHFG